MEKSYLGSPIIVCLGFLYPEDEDFVVYAFQHKVTREEMSNWGSHYNHTLPDGYYGSGQMWKPKVLYHGTRNVEIFIVDRIPPEQEYVSEKEWASYARQEYGDACVNIGEGQRTRTKRPCFDKKVPRPLKMATVKLRDNVVHSPRAVPQKTQSWNDFLSATYRRANPQPLNPNASVRAAKEATALSLAKPHWTDILIGKAG